MLEVSTLCCLRGEREVFRDVTFSVGSGQWVHVRGENGAGKTTLLRALTGLLRPTAGTIAWNGQTLHALGEEYHRSILYLGHANGIKDDLDAQENLRAVQAIADSSSEVQVTDAMRALGLDPANTTPIRALSQGQKRRVALARLALGDARLWILDEPFAALDEITRQQLNDDLLQICRTTNLTVLFVTHSAAEAVYLSNRVMIMSARPGAIFCEMNINAPEQRAGGFRHSAQFTAYCGEISSALHSGGK